MRKLDPWKKVMIFHEVDFEQNKYEFYLDMLDTPIILHTLIFLGYPTYHDKLILILFEIHFVEYHYLFQGSSFLIGYYHL